MPQTACFFKDPYDVDVHGFTDQFELLRRYIGRAREDAKRIRSA